MGAWKFCRRFSSYGLALGSTFALHVVSQGGDQATMSKAQADALAMVNASPAYHDLIRNRQTAVTGCREAQEEYMEFAIDCFKLARGLQPDGDFPDIPNISYEQIADTAHRGSLTAMFQVVKKHFPRTYESTVDCVRLVERWTSTLKECMEIRNSLKKRVQAIDARLVYDVSVAATDHLPRRDLSSQLMLFEDAGTGHKIDMRAVMTTDDKEVRRKLAWRVQLDNEWRTSLEQALLCEHTRQRLLEELMRDDVPKQPRSKKASKARRAARKRGTRETHQAVSEEPGEPGEPEEPEECVVCLDRPQGVSILPCGHTVMCHDCANQWWQRGADCPYCRMPIIMLVPVI